MDAAVLSLLKSRQFQLPAPIRVRRHAAPVTTPVRGPPVRVPATVHVQIPAVPVNLPVKNPHAGIRAQLPVPHANRVKLTEIVLNYYSFLFFPGNTTPTPLSTLHSLENNSFSFDNSLLSDLSSTWLPIPRSLDNSRIRKTYKDERKNNE